MQYLILSICGISIQWDNLADAKRLVLDSSSPLYGVLCAPTESSVCSFPGKVVLEEDLVCSGTECDGVEYSVDIIRTVRVVSSPNPIYYEYVRPPCVDFAFYNDGKKVKHHVNDDLVASSMMCADPRTIVAAEACCNPGWENSNDRDDHGFMFCSYLGQFAFIVL